MSTLTEEVLEHIVSDDGPGTPSGPCDPPKTPPAARHVIVLHCFLSFVICNIDRISLSVAIIPMGKAFSWSESTKGLVQSAFFVGYMTTQIPGGMVADRRGGRAVLAGGVLAWSVATLLTPVAARLALPALLAARVVLGIGEGVAMPAMNAMVAAWVPAAERARALSLVYSGMYAGSILGLVAAPGVMRAAGWQALFYVFGLVGIAWVALRGRRTGSCHVGASAAVAAVPWVSMFACANVGGRVADGLLQRGWSTTRTRKTMQSVGFCGAAVFLGLVCAARTAGQAMGCVSAGLGLAAFSQSGVYANHQDIGPRVAGTLLGISNTFASVAGVVGVYVSGVVLDRTGHDWRAVWGMAIAFDMVGLVVYNLFATSERQW
ncbi:unnamed protein product [Chondrus crispus]|uniref:Major facilitator superfamily (MFS) profile domain-containing protein n=1 Tax=Chondrus crispus TaxID=2769 RepID=R7QFP0_CHOCR|nr:unnamed protein product [Chondrus crispus]CDF36240.1 unnamed protein product [Chondrus crispus]|eukprot:XP_005716059.1 unnamed protein product [Chondrus crispus]